jgi:hypothetical protein
VACTEDNNYVLYMQLEKQNENIEKEDESQWLLCC